MGKVFVLSLMLLLVSCGRLEDPPPLPPTSGVAEIQEFSAADLMLGKDKTTTLVAHFVGASAEIDQDVGEIQSGVPVVVAPKEDVTYTLTVTAEDGTAVERRSQSRSSSASSRSRRRLEQERDRWRMPSLGRGP